MRSALAAAWVLIGSVLTVFSQPVVVSPGTSMAGQQIRVGFWNLSSLRDVGHERRDFRSMARAMKGMDCVALGEIRDDRSLAKLVGELQILGGQWNKVKISRPVGFTKATSERYAILYRSDRIDVDGRTSTLRAPGLDVEGVPGRHRLEHSPFVCRFVTRDGRLDFTVMIMNSTQRNAAKTVRGAGPEPDPNAFKDAEITAMKDVFLRAQAMDSTDQDLILMGNFRRDVGAASFADLLSVEGMVDMTDPAAPTMLGGGHTPDHIFFQKHHVVEFHGARGVERFEDSVFGGDAVEAGRVCSQHRPIWIQLVVPEKDDD